MDPTAASPLPADGAPTTTPGVPQPPRAPPPPSAPRSARRRRRWWRWLLALVLLLLALLVALVAALLHLPAALPWSLEQVPGLRSQGVRGTLAGGDLEIDALDYALPDDGGRLHIDGLKVHRRGLALWPQPGVDFSLHLKALSIASLRWQSGKAAAKPPELPTTLRLPLVLKIDRLTIARIQVDELPPITGFTAAVSLGAEGGALHRIDELALQFEQARLAGRLQVGADAPLAVTARLEADRAEVPAWGAKLALDGPLAKLAADLRLKGQATGNGAAPALSAQATLAPFATWPLQALNLATEELDLGTLSPRLPRTVLAGSARVQSSGMDQPARVDVTLRNSLPGAWDAGRLPLRQLTLQASGEPRHTDRLTLDRFELLLGDAVGPAGRIQGQGRWQADTLAIDLKLDGLLPGRLDSRAAAIELGGPLTLRASGLVPAAPGTAAAPNLEFDATLKGRALDRSGLPVQLQLVGDASASHLQVRRAEASSGKASALARLDAKADARGWQLRGDVALNQFDPLPWWPGPAGSAWRRGPHRLDGQLELDLHLSPPAPAATAAGTAAPAIDRALRAIEGQASLKLDKSQLAGMPVTAAVTLRSGPTRLDADLQARIAGNELRLLGGLDKPAGKAVASDQLQLTLQMPAIGALSPLSLLLADIAPGLAGHWPRSGAVQAEARVEGRWPQLRSHGELRVSALASPDLTLQQATLGWRAGTALDDALALQLDARGLSSAGQTLSSIKAEVDGSLRNHRLKLQADSPLRPPAWAENLLGPLGSGTRAGFDGRGLWLPDAGGGGRWQLQDLRIESGARQAAAGAAAAAAAGAKASAPGAAAASAARPAAPSDAPPASAPPTNGAPPWLLARSPAVELRLDAQGAPLSLRAEPGRLQLLSTALNWRTLEWQAGTGGASGGLTLLAELETIDVARLLARLQPTTGWGGDLTLGGRIEIRSAARVDADIVLERGGGDLTLTDDLGETLALGLTDLRLALSAHDGVWQFAQGLAGTRIGQVGGAQVLRTAPGERFPGPATPLSGTLEARVADIGVWSAWVPPGWRLVGKLRTSASVGGTLGAPELSGEMRGSGIGARNLLQGVNLSDGELAITLAGDRAQIERFVFKGGDGSLTVSGDALLGAAPVARLKLVADRFRLLGRLDRRLVTSGSAEVRLDADRLKVDGDLLVDEGLIDVSRGDAPTLDDDVQVRRDGSIAITRPSERPALAPPPRPLRQADVSVRIDLGQQLRLRGHGIDTLLRGKLVASSPGGRLALHGTVRTVEGKFAAYGQKLEIRQGEIDFIGPLDNPRINVLALRNDVDVVVGVSVTGSATAPRVRLYSEPDKPEFDKLSWLVLGRSPSSLGSGDTALLQRAAMALLAGDKPGPTDNLMGAIGLTDFSVRQTEGETRDTVFSVGKQLSQRWYLGYERSVNATTGTWQLIYKVAQRFTLRAQSGTDNALDVIWSWRW